MIGLQLGKAISLLVITTILLACQKKMDTSPQLEFINKDFEKKLYYFIEKSDSLHLNKTDFILVYLLDIRIDQMPYDNECAIIFYANEPFGCENYVFGTKINDKNVLFYDDSDCLDFNELIKFKSYFECSQFYVGKDGEIDSFGDLYYKYENGKLLMRD